MTVAQIEVGAGNHDEFVSWNGEAGQLWAANAAYFDTSVRHHHDWLMNSASIGRHDRVLDIGCGTGQCTRDAARRAGDGDAVGIDVSLPMIRAAEHAAHQEQLTNVAFVQGDAQVHQFPPGRFDVVLSRFGSMCFADQADAFTNTCGALRAGGRLTLVSWRSAAENDWITTLRRALVPDGPPPESTPNAPGAFRHADHDDTVAILAAAGFDDIHLDRLDLPIYLGRDADHAYSMLVPMFAWMVDDLEPDAKNAALSRMRMTLGAHQTSYGVTFGSAAWLITARRPQPVDGGRGS